MKENGVLKAVSYVLLPIIILIFIISTIACVALFSYNYSSKEEYFQSDEFNNRMESAFTNIADTLIFAKERNYNVYNDGNNKIFKDTIIPGNLNEVKNVKFIAIYGNKVLTNLDTENENLETIIAQMQNLYEAHKYVQYVNNEISSNSSSLAEFLKNDIGFIRNYTINYYTIENSTENSRVEEYYDADEYTILIPEQYEIEVELEEQAELQNVEVDEEALATNSIGVSDLSNRERRTYKKASLDEFNIYMTYDEELVPESNINLILNFLEIIKPYKIAICITVPITLVFMVILIVYLINSVGYKKGVEGIALNDFDKIPFEIILILFFVCLGICLGIADELFFENYSANLETTLVLGLSFYTINITIFEIMAVTFVKRIKAKTFLKTSFFGQIFKFAIKVSKKIWNIAKAIIQKAWKEIKKIIEKFTYNKNLTVKYFCFVTICMVLMFIFGISLGGLGLTLNVIIAELMIYWFFLRIQSFKRFEDALKKVSEGTLEEKLEKSDFALEFKNSVEYLNNISNGFETAIEESMKSERMKTELITNVSHDIKTPLTSIINYVDLLKKEEFDNEKAKEYLDILDSKSQRLKRLTEDLLEASKASSGNLKLDLKQINIVELMNQAMGEFEDKFKEKKLEIIPQFDKPTINIKADSRYMYRVIENLFSNVSKYALDGSRVYIDVSKKNNDALIAIKNISKERLNITEEELMQRFVRGDKSRTTEGSGLGLAIAKSLVNLQGGKLDCKIDGDLFKIEITMKWI